MINDKPIIVLGSGLAGYSLVREFRKLDKETPVLMITQDDGHSYSKPMLSTGFTKNKTADDLSMADPGKMASQLNVSIRNFSTVTKIDTQNEQVLLGEEALGYQKLVLALGAQVKKLNFPGSDHPKVISINNLMDYRAFRDQLQPNQHVLIMGAGLIGCEYANDLLIGGYQVSVVDPSETAMNGLIPAEAGTALSQGLQQAGAHFHFGNYVQHIEELDDGQLCATLHSGKKVLADLIISAVGLKPDLHLAEAADIEGRQGILTNPYLETSKNNVFALGDCAETLEAVRLYVLPLMASARALAKTLSGEKTAVNFGVMPIATKTPACPVVTVPPPNTKGDWQFSTHERGLIGRYYDASEKLNGFVLTGDALSEKTKLIKELSNN